jgi:hypothetical protein
VFSERDRQLLRQTAIRGRLAFALGCFRCALAHFGEGDVALTALTEVCWSSVETDGVVAADRAWRRLAGGRTP